MLLFVEVELHIFAFHLTVDMTGLYVIPADEHLQAVLSALDSKNNLTRNKWLELRTKRNCSNYV